LSFSSAAPHTFSPNDLGKKIVVHKPKSFTNRFLPCTCDKQRLAPRAKRWAPRSSTRDEHRKVPRFRAAGDGLGTTIKYQRGNAGTGLGATINYQRGNAGSSMGMGSIK